MRFRRRRSEEPEINLIPFIDVLLVILIFLMLSTTYSKYSELQITLPTADAERIRERPAEIVVSISAQGQYLIDKKPVEGRSVDILALELQAAAAGKADPVVIVSADALPATKVSTSAAAAARLQKMDATHVSELFNAKELDVYKGVSIDKIQSLAAHGVDQKVVRVMSIERSKAAINELAAVGTEMKQAMGKVALGERPGPDALKKMYYEHRELAGDALKDGVRAGVHPFQTQKSARALESNFHLDVAKVITFEDPPGGHLPRLTADLFSDHQHGQNQDKTHLLGGAAHRLAKQHIHAQHHQRPPHRVRQRQFRQPHPAAP